MIDIRPGRRALVLGGSASVLGSRLVLVFSDPETKFAAAGLNGRSMK